MITKSTCRGACQFLCLEIKIMLLRKNSSYYYQQMEEKLNIKMDWLDKLGLKMPTTMAELYDVMVAFKE